MADELARQRRELPWVRIEKKYRFDTGDGTRTLAELFGGRSQLMFYHFMFGPSYEAGCPVNSSMADGMDGLMPHLHARDVTLLLVSQAPLDSFGRTRSRMGWSVPWGCRLEHRLQRRLRRLLPPGAGTFMGLATKAGCRRSWPRTRPPTGTDVLGYLSESPAVSVFTRSWRRGLPDLCDRGARGRVPDGLLPGPGPGAEGTRRGRRRSRPGSAATTSTHKAPRAARLP